MAWTTAGLVLVLCCWHLSFVLTTASTADLTILAWCFVAAKTVIELVGASLVIGFTVSALTFVLMPERRWPVAASRSSARPSVAVVYLCCYDADWGALKSLATLSFKGPLTVLIHDDGRRAADRLAVDRMAEELERQRDWRVRVLRRPERDGGKAGAVNYVLEQTAAQYDYFLLCDNDSTVLDPDLIQKALARMEASDAGVVQFRSVPVTDPSNCGANRRLAESIGAFHAFLAPAARFGWMPFIGHNALLRTAAVQGVGGFTPDFFSDDLDLTVRLNLAGWRVIYAPDIAMGEKHPPNYTAFRKRTYKWAYGCVQTLRAHWRSIITARTFSFAEKLSFFQFTAFYLVQSLLLCYLTFALIAVPLGAPGAFSISPVASLLVGLAIVGTVYAPLLAFYIRTPQARQRGWTKTLILCGLVYGGTDFTVVRGIFDALRRRQRNWVPTNGVAATAVEPSLFLEAAFGLALLTVPLVARPELLYLPCWFLFAGKFLFGPALSLLYRDSTHEALDPFLRTVAVGSADDDDLAGRRHRAVLQHVAR